MEPPLLAKTAWQRNRYGMYFEDREKMIDRRRANKSRPGITDLAVKLTGSPEDQFRLHAAASIADGFDAHIVGVHLHSFPGILEVTDPLRSGTIRSLLEESDKAADRSYQRVEATFRGLNVSHELRRLHGLAEDLGSQMAETARTVDLFIGTRPYGEPMAHHQIEEKVLFGSGRGSLLLPPGGSAHSRFETIVVAWDGSREATRAVSEAMPFLAKAKLVHLVTISSATDEEAAAKRLLSLSMHLGRCEVEATRTVVPYQSSTGEQIERFAHQQGADLIVAGAYGHPRFLEWVFGGATQYLLRRSTLPILMAH